MNRAPRLAMPSIAIIAAATLAALPAWGDTATARHIDDTCGAAPDAGFSDVPAGNPHNPTIDCIKHLAITSGKTATTYDPAGSLRRDQLATFLAATIEAGGKTLPTPTQDYFGDDDGNPHEENINKLAEAGVFDGSFTNFDVGRVPTRAEMSQHTAAAMAYAGVLSMSGSVPEYFSDDDGLAAEDAINRLAMAGVITGKTTTAFAPTETLRRDQMATFLARSIDLIEDGGSPPEEGGGTGGGTGTATSCGTPAVSSPVAISTVLADGPGNDVEVYNDSEYVRLVNTGGTDIDISGWVLEDPADNSIKIGTGFIIEAGSTFTVYSGDGDDVSTSRYFADRSQAMWNNSGDTATLCDSFGRKVDDHSY